MADRGSIVNWDRLLTALNNQHRLPAESLFDAIIQCQAFRVTVNNLTITNSHIFSSVTSAISFGSCKAMVVIGIIYQYL